MKLSNIQYKLLIRICKHPIKLSSLSDLEKQRVFYFADNKYVSLDPISDPNTPRITVDTDVRITPAGEYACDLYHREKIRWLIPVFISIAACVISIISLYKSSQPIEIYIDTNTSTDIENTSATTEK